MNVNELNTLKLRSLLFSLCLVLGFSNLNSQPLVCGDIVVSLDPADCTATITPADVVESPGNFPLFPADFTINLFFDEAMTMPVPTSPVLNSTHIGQTIIVQAVYAPPGGGGNSCWSTITAISDYTVPDLSCALAPVNVDCTDDITPSATIGDPIIFPVDLTTVTVVDNNDGTYTLQGFDPCGDATLTYVDVPIAGACPGGPVATITRTWTVTDESSNTKSCMETIIIDRLSGPVVFPPNVDLECNSANPPSTDPSSTGYPTVNGVNITSTPNACELQSSKVDTPLGTCGGASVINRSWTVIDCMGNIVAGPMSQVIKVSDTTAPSVTCPSNFTVSTDQNTCTASANLPNAVISDACSGYTTATTADNGIITGNVITGLPIGVTTVTITVTDACNNIESCTYTITVNDQVAPTPICETSRTVSLTNASPTLVPAHVFDDGSYDACGDVTFLVSRMEGSQCTFTDATPFGDFVPFFCCDIGETIMVALQVTDESGNTNSCMVEVTIQDKIDPVITCPTDKELDCHQDHLDLSITGSATATDNCGTIIPTFADSGTLNSCGVGTIVRTWTADDGNGNIVSCDQTIEVKNLSPFYINPNDDNDPNDDIIWPADVLNSGCTLPASTGVPILLNEDLCSQANFLAPSDFTLNIAGGCQRIFRTWTVFDNCQESVNGGCGNTALDAANIACWTYVQTIEVINTTAPVISVCETPAEFCSFDPLCQTGSATLTVTANDDCNELNYNYEIDLDYLNNPGIDIPWTADPGNDGTHTDNFPLGTHLVRWKVEDFCGNFTMCEYPFTIRDCKAPTPSLYSNLTTQIMQTGMLDFSAQAFDNLSSPSFDNCGITEWRIVFPVSNTPAPPLTSTDVFTFTCAQVAMPQPLSVQIWIYDGNNWASEIVELTISNNTLPDGSAVCSSPPGYASVSGAILNEEGVQVEHVMVEISGDMNDEEQTNETGSYSFDLPLENNYTISPDRNDDPLNGITTFDLVKINKHILESELLPTPYKIIAADINHSGTITTVDLVELRKLILFIETEFSNNTSWRFVDADFVFPDPADPFGTSFPEVYTINDLSQDMQADFVGVKIGDVNCSAAPNGFAGSSDDRSEEEDLRFIVEDQQLKAGATYTIDFKLEEVKSLQGFQFTLAFDQGALAFENIIPGTLQGMGENNFGLSLLDKGIITSSWHSAEVIDDNETTSFSLNFTALADVSMSDVININSRYTKAQAYFDNGFANVSLAFESENGIATEHFQLFQNRPNPFKGETVIGFVLPAQSSGTLTIYDLSGRVIKVVDEGFNQGYNELSISSAELNGHGVFYYRLEVADHTATRKMVLLK